jgi:hypothetical protein
MRAMAKGTVERSSGAGHRGNAGRHGSGKRTATSQEKATFLRAFVDALHDILAEERRRRAA